MGLPSRILLVEDDPLWQAGIAALLAGNPAFTLVGVADAFEEALDLFEQFQPQVVLLDWKIRGERDGLVVGQAMLAQGFPSERIILISSSSPSLIPAHPFLVLPKSRLAEELLALLESVTPG